MNAATTSDRADEQAEQLERVGGPGAEAEAGEQQRERLLDPARTQVEQVEEVGRQQQQREVGDVVEPLAPAARDRVGGERQRPRRLDRPGREAAGEHRAGVAAPAARGVGVGAAAERVVEQPEQGDAEHVDHPAPQLGIEQVEVGAIVEHRQRRQRQQRAGDERRAGGERDPAPAVVLAREAGAQHVGEPGAEQQRGQSAAESARPGLSISCARRRRSRGSPGRAGRAAGVGRLLDAESRPRRRRARRRAPPARELVDVVDAGQRRDRRRTRSSSGRCRCARRRRSGLPGPGLRMPSMSRVLDPVGVVGSRVATRSSGRWRTTTTAVDVARLAAVAAEAAPRAARRTDCRRARATGRRARRRAVSAAPRGLVAPRAPRGPRSAARPGVGRLADDGDLARRSRRRARARARMSSASAGSSSPRATTATSRPRSRLATTAGCDRVAELALGLELGLELVDLVAGLVEVRFEARLEVLGGARDEVGAEADPDQDADREGEEDGRERGRVVARRIAHQRSKRDLDLQPDEVEELLQRRRADHDDHDQDQRARRNAHICQPLTPGL